MQSMQYDSRYNHDSSRLTPLYRLQRPAPDLTTCLDPLLAPGSLWSGDNSLQVHLEPQTPSEESVSNDEKVFDANTVSKPGCKVEFPTDGNESEYSESLEDHCEEDAAGKTVSDDLVRRCQCMGMSSTAVHDWALLHRSPVTAMLFFFGPHLYNLFVMLIMVTGVDFTRFHITIPSCIACASHVACVHYVARLPFHQRRPLTNVCFLSQSTPFSVASAGEDARSTAH